MATATLPEIFTPRKNAPVRYANYDGHEGYTRVTEDWTVLFRTSGSLWHPVLPQAELVILSLVGDAETQLVVHQSSIDGSNYCQPSVIVTVTEPRHRQLKIDVALVLDTLAGGYAAIATSRHDLEV